MLKKILPLVCLLCSLQVFASDTTQVLFLGNSFTSTNDMPDIFGRMANKAGYNIDISMYAPGGVFVGDTRQGTSAHAYNPYVFDIIRSKRWDYIVIQDNQAAFSDQIGLFPPVANVIVGHTRLRDSAIAANPCTKIILFAGWCFKNGWQQSPPIFNTGSEMNERVYVNYKILNNSINGIVSPIGIAWNRIIKDLPTTDLWAADEAHPSYAGSYLTAATLYATIFAANPELIMYNALMDSATARYMRKTAYETVIDSLVPANLDKNTIALTYTGTGLSTTGGYAKYEWYKNNVLIGTTTTPLFTVVPVKGVPYQVIATDKTGCKFRSVEYSSKTTGIESASYIGHAIHVYPNPNTGTFNITIKESSETVSVVLYSLTGSQVYSRTFDSVKTGVYRNTLPQIADGIYILKVQTEKGIHTTRMQVGGQ